MYLLVSCCWLSMGLFRGIWTFLIKKEKRKTSCVLYDGNYRLAGYCANSLTDTRRTMLLFNEYVFICVCAYMCVCPELTLFYNMA